MFGAGGRMGSTVCQAVDDAADLQLVAAVDPHHAGIDLRQVAPGVIEDLPIAGSAQEMIDQQVDVAIDFTEVGAARANLAFMAEHGIHAVVGTTGFHRADLAALEAAFVDSNCLVAPNFAIGAVLMMRFAEMAAPYFDSAEVIELHHDQKLDAPSGTAMLTAERMAAASDDWAEDPTENEVLPGAGEARARRGSTCTRSGSAAWWRTRKCCWGPPGRRCRFGTTRSTGHRSCRACCWGSERSPTTRA